MAVAETKGVEVAGARSGVDRTGLLDGFIVASFLGLTFLLGCFPNKDVDFWWHLRTGDWIRAEGQVPTHDLYTYTVPENEWIDLHWVFQVLLSHGYERFGVIGLNLIKCVITTLAVGLLVTAKRPEWPSWAMVLGWLPAIVLLGGRMYIRPETLTLFYMAVFLAVLVRLDRRPWLAYALPFTQAAWVNTQGLFVFGPILLVFAAIDALWRVGWRSKEARRWWRIVGPAGLLTGLACLLNPYGLRGALYPLTLLGTMGNPIFRDSIGELMPIVKLIEDSAGRIVPMLGVHLTVMVLGGLSFVGPIVWMVVTRMTRREPVVTPATKKGSRKKKSSVKVEEGGRWRLSLFRVCLYLAFTALSFQATRNSHQFAAVVGALTAWNLGEWAAASRARRERGGVPVIGAIWPRVVTLWAVWGVIGLVGSGALYQWTKEGRTVGLGEEPAWFPHAAVAFAGQEGLPPRFAGFHIGHAALFIHHNGPERKVFADPRLEVMKAEQYGRYLELQRSVVDGGQEASARLEQAGRPVLLIDHAYNSAAGAGMMTETAWPCVWFGPVAAVFVHRSDAGAAGLEPVDFLARHFGRQKWEDAEGMAEIGSVARALNAYVLRLMEQRGRADLAEPMAMAGLDVARRARALDPSAGEPWAIACTLEFARGEARSSGPLRRGGEPFDALLDLGPARLAYAGRRALELQPDNTLTLTTLAESLASRGLEESALPLLDRLAKQPARTKGQAASAGAMAARRDAVARSLGSQPVIERANGNEVERSIRRLIDSGRAESAARLIEEQYPVGERSWPRADQLATLWLHLGWPERAREVWGAARGGPAGVAEARIGASWYAEDDLEAAREAYRSALVAAPELFEARYGLAIVERDAGDADAAGAAARSALEVAPTEVARARVQAISRMVGPYEIKR